MNISPEAKEFILLGLEKNSFDRLTIDEMVSHPWLKDCSLPKEKEIHCPKISQALYLAHNGHKVSQRNMDLIHSSLKKLSDQ